MTKINIMREYLDGDVDGINYYEKLKEGLISKKGLCRLMMRDNPDVLGDPDNPKEMDRTRSLLRHLTDANGGYRGIEGTHPFKSDIATGIKATLPESLADPLPNFIFPDHLNKTLMFSDPHFPYHDIKAIMAMVEDSKKRDIDSIIINGDLIDMYQASDFMKDPRNASLDKELEIGHSFILYLKENINVPIYYKLGNHEARWESMLKKKTPALYGIIEYEFTNLIKSRGWGVETIEEDQMIKYGKLSILHGHEIKYGAYNPVNPARGIFLRAKSSVIVGHWHQASFHPESDLNGKSLGCWSLGCLCNLRPDYSPFAYLKWNHSFAYLSKKTNGDFHVEDRRIINGELL